MEKTKTQIKLLDMKTILYTIKKKNSQMRLTAD